MPSTIHSAGKRWDCNNKNVWLGILTHMDTSHMQVSINGADVVYKDVVEPLETVSVTMIKSDKTSISDYGSLEDVSSTLAKSVLSAPVRHGQSCIKLS